MDVNENYQVTKSEGHHMCRPIVGERDKYRAALAEIKERFESKQALHKDDCFAYQVACRALGEGQP